MLTHNPHSFPESYVRSMSDRRIPEPNRISITELLQPPQLRALWLANYDEIPLVIGEDDHDLFHGNAVHFYLAHHARAEAIAEERLSYVVDGWTVHGTPDYAELSGQDWLGLGDGGTLIDWKTTKVRALRYDKVEWEQQVNLYAYLLQVNGVTVSQLVVWAFLKDWDRSKRGTDPDYPAAHACKLYPRLWPITEQHEFLMERLRLHREAQDGIYRPCTPAERWQHTTYALMKEGNQRATKVFETYAEAETYADAATERPRQWGDWYTIEERVGPPLRCQSWCPVSAYCLQRKLELRDIYEAQEQGGLVVVP